ncbi:peptide chain release factor N(5)-glutamine methyltransferase [Rhodanobacter sp. BL-MT-08]
MLPDKPEENVDNTLRALWFAASGEPRSVALAMQGDLPRLGPGEATMRLENLVSRRLAGEPLAHITGRQRFMGLDMLSSAQALIPRAETEQLVFACLDLLRHGERSITPRVIDVCTGSGNIAFAIAHHVATSIVAATDLSAEAITFARRNGAYLNLQERVAFYTGDLMAPLVTSDHLERTDLIVCAPPYICTAKVGQMANEISGHEPRLAFDGGPFGVTILMRLIEDAPRFLRAGGWLALEVGLGQGALLVKRLQKNDLFREVRGLADRSGAVRVVIARRH